MKEYMQSGHTNMTFTVMQHSRPVSCYEKLVQLKLLTCTNNEENKKISNRGRVYTEVWNTTFRKWKPQQKALQSIYRLHLLILLLWSIISRYRIVDFFFLLKATQLISVQHIKQIYPTLTIFSYTTRVFTYKYLNTMKPSQTDQYDGLVFVITIVWTCKTIAPVPAMCCQTYDKGWVCAYMWKQACFSIMHMGLQDWLTDNPGHINQVTSSSANITQNQRH